MREVSRGAVALRGEPSGVAGRGAASGAAGPLCRRDLLERAVVPRRERRFRGSHAGQRSAFERDDACVPRRTTRKTESFSPSLRRLGPERGAPIVASSDAASASLDAADNRELPPLHYAARRENYAAFAATARRKPFQGRAGSAIRRPGRARRPVNLRISGADPAADHPPGRPTPSRMERPYDDQAQTGIRHGPFRRVPQPVRMKDAQARKA